jgi:hypothetical protein
VLSLARLWWIYAIIPASLLAVAVDRTVLGGHLAETLPRSPDSFLLLALVFGTPHIVASNLILFTTPEYLRFYRRRLVVISLTLLVAVVTAGLLLPRDVVFALIAGWTVTHVVKQQIGIGNISARLSGPWFRLWAVCGIASGIVFYNAIFLSHRLTGPWAGAVRGTVAVLTAVVALVTLVLVTRVERPLGRRWVWGNGGVMVFAGLLFLAGYPFFAILIPRFVHDLTAFAFYVNHDVNRSRAGLSSWLLRPFDRLPLGAVLALPLIAIGISALLERPADAWFNAVLRGLTGHEISRPVSLGIVGFLGLLHYAFESFTWKDPSPYRRHVGIGLS